MNTEGHEQTHPRLVFGCQMCIDRVTVSKYRTVDERRESSRRKSDADKARTKASHEALERGEHPYTHKPLDAQGRKCRDCPFFFRHHAAKTFFKCTHPSMPEPNHGPSTDIRATWPACELIEST